MEEITDITLCDACYAVEKRAFAGTFCIDCHHKLCTECKLDHAKSPATREHKIVKLKGLAVGYMIENPQTRSLLDLARCDYHELHDVRYFCYDHKEVYCSLCRTVKHAHCNEKPIVDICGELETRDLENVLVTLDQLAGGLDKARHDRQRQIHEMESMKEKCVQDIQSLKRRIATLLEQLDKNAGQKIAEVDRRVEEFAEQENLFDDAMKNVSSLSQQVKHVFQCGDKEAIFTAETKTQKLKMDYTLLIEHCKIDTAPLKLVLNQNVQIIDLLSTCECLGEVNLQTLPVHDGNVQVVPRDLSNETEYNPHVTVGKAPVRNPESLVPSMLPVPYGTATCPQPLLFNQLGNYLKGNNSSSSSSAITTIYKTRRSFLNIKLKHQNQYAIKTKEDKGLCDITGLAFLPSGDLVICDHSNSAVKVLDPKFQVIHRKRLDAYPWDVTVIGSNEVAVTLSETKKVQLLTISSDGLHSGTSFQTRDMCWGIEAFHDRMIITFHGNPGYGYVQIRRRNGEVLKEIPIGGDGNLPSLSPSYVSLDSTKGRFFLTDGVNDSVIGYTVAGKARTVAQPENMIWPKGIVLDEDSNMLISAHIENQLKMIKNKGQDGCVKFRDIQRPQALAFRWDDLSLVVGSNKGNGITVLTFENK